MDIAHLGTLTDVVSLRDPARRNHFTILAKARLGSRQVLLHQSRAKQSWSPVQDVDVWFKVLSEDPDSSSESCLLRVLGVLPTPLPKSIAVNSVPGSISSAHGLDRPVYVVDYHERGSLRSCLDKGEFSHSNWPAKLTVLKDIAKALHYIRCHMPGQQHGALSSDTVYIDKDGHAFLSWHSCGRTRQDFESGKCRDWRWFSPNTLLQLQDTLDQDNDDPMEVIDLELDDMYSFGVLAWETVTDELPFEKLQLFSRQRPAQNIDKRFLKRPPRPVMEIIERCLDTDKDNRPSWCSILSQLDALVPEALDAEYDEIDNDVNPPLVVDLAQPLPSPTSLDDNKSKVVEMMESILGSTFYKKELPVHLDSFTGVAGRKLFREMIQAGTGECFFSLFTSFSTQNDPAFCGVSSLSMVLNALEIDPRRQWKGVWRWYTDEQLDCCASISEMRLKGITFNQFSCLARCHASVVSKPADRHSLEEFRRDIQLITSSEGTHMVISFSRPALGQTGSGHFSPIGGYHAGEDKVLVLDSARFKYPPFFVTVQELWGSLLPVDPETGKCRGYFLISANEQQKSDIQRRRVGVAKGENGIGTSPSNGTTTASLSSASSSQLDQSQAPSSWIPSPGHYSNVEASWMRSPGHHPNVEASSLQPTQSQASSSPKPSPGQDPSINTHPKDDISADCNCDCDC